MAYSTGHDADSLHLHPQQFAPQPANSPPPPFFRHPGVPIDPSLESAIPSNRSIHGSPHFGHANLHPQHLQHGYYNGMGTPPPPSHTSPRFTHPSPRRQRQGSTPVPFTPQDRQLPARDDVSEETVEDAYVKFILYCNPCYGLDVDTSKLKELFNSMPKSDGKSFSLWNLFALIRKLENKQIPSWIQLALDLGVDPPDTQKGQSTQKVQQWTVRLKRWMSVSRMTPFFDYLLGKDNPYFTHIPHPHEPFHSDRAGIPLTEDLALRALDPVFRPKRGRKKAEDQDDDASIRGTTPEPKRQHMDPAMSFASNDGFVHSASAYPQSAIPMSAHPGEYDHDPWTAATSMNPHSFGHGYGRGPLRWGPSDTPLTAHPSSAIQRLSPGLEAVMEEPRSAVTPSSNKRKRRHGPAVSSAWNSSGTTGGKLRGRPPSNRTVKDGPFVTFPANPYGKEAPTPSIERPPMDFNPTAGASSAHPFSQQASDQSSRSNKHILEPQSAPPISGPAFPFPSEVTPAAAAAPNIRPPLTKRVSLGPRGERLSLKVPPHVGRPVQLVTPTLVVQSPSEPPSAISPGTRIAPITQYPTPGSVSDLEPIAEVPTAEASTRTVAQVPQKAAFASAPAYETLKRALVADLLRADIKGRKQRLKGAEAKGLAEAILQRMRSQDCTFNDEQFRQSCCIWLGIGTGAPAASAGGKKIFVQRFRTHNDGYDSPIDEGDEIQDNDPIKETFDITWSLQLGSLLGEFSMKELRINDKPTSEEPDGPKDDEPDDWKGRYLMLETKLMEKDREARELRDKILSLVFDV